MSARCRRCGGLLVAGDDAPLRSCLSCGRTEGATPRPPEEPRPAYDEPPDRDSPATLATLSLDAFADARADADEEDQPAPEETRRRARREYNGIPWLPDDGCDIAPHCLQCPLSACRYDLPNKRAGQLRLEMRLRDLLASGLSVEAAVDTMGLSRRTIFRLKAKLGLDTAPGGALYQGNDDGHA